jgi:phytanoyl-CoA hydroxylase
VIVLLPEAKALDLDEPLRSYAESGFARIGRILDDEALEALRARADDLMLGRVRYEGLFYQLDTDTGAYADLVRGKGWQGPSLRYRKLEKIEKDPLFLALIENVLFERIARKVVGDRVVIYRAVLMNKPAEGGTDLPFHQDGGRFWGLDRDPTLQIWTTLDDAPVSGGCLEVVPKSHKNGLATPLGGVVPEEIVASSGNERRTIPLPARAGEAIVLHNHIWHRSGRSSTGHPRRAISICYMSADVRCLRKRRAPREFTRVFARD